MKHFSTLLLQLSTKGHRSESTIFVFLPVLLDFFNCCWNDRMKTRGNPSNPQSLSSWKPQDPFNFQPIALTSCVGNLFTTILMPHIHDHEWIPRHSSGKGISTRYSRLFRAVWENVRSYTWSWPQVTPLEYHIWDLVEWVRGGLWVWLDDDWLEFFFGNWFLIKLQIWRRGIR